MWSESIGRTNATAGQAVVFAGGTVVVAILGLRFVGIPFVGCARLVAASSWWVPVLVGHHLAPGSARLRRPSCATCASRRREGCRHVQACRRHRAETRRPTPVNAAGCAGRNTSPTTRGATLIATTAVLLALAAPALDLRLGQADAGTEPDHRAPTDGPTTCSPTGSATASTVRCCSWSNLGPEAAAEPTRRPGPSPGFWTTVRATPASWRSRRRR